MAIATLTFEDREVTVDNEILIGRHRSCGLQLADPMVSRRHAVVKVTDGTVFFECLGSPNGVRIQGERVEGQKPLHDGDQISVGNSTIAVHISASAEKAAEEADAEVAASKTDEPAVSEDLSNEARLVYQGSEVPLKGTLVLGRHRDCDLQIADAKASRRHIEVELKDDGTAVLHDLGSANGTRVNGQSVTGDSPLFHGDRITIGSSHVVLQLPGQHEVVDAKEEADAEVVERPASARATVRPEDLLGELIGGNRINSLVGQGALGVVYTAHQLSLDRDVAIKVFRPEVVQADSSFADRVIEQARLTGRVNSEYIASVHECGSEDGTLWYSMESVKGSSLGAIVDRDGPMSVDMALLVIERVAQGLKEAHAAQVFHHDLKPEAVFINPNGGIKILELGLGQVLQEGLQSTEKSAVVGTPAYMSPEKGRSEAGDGRSDLYSLGCILYFLLCGRPPFKGRTPMATIKAQANDPIPSVADDGHPAVLDTLLAGLLAKNPDWRYSDAGELLEELAQTRSQLPAAEAPAASPAPAPERNKPITRTNRAHTTHADRKRKASQRNAITGVVISVVIIGALIMFGPQVMKTIAAAMNENQTSTQNIADNTTANTQNGTTTQANNSNVSTNAGGNNNTSTPNTTNSADNDWEAQWSQTQNNVKRASDNNDWADAEFTLNTFANQARSAGENDLAATAQSALVALRVKTTDWVNSQLGNLSSDTLTQLQQLASLRDRSSNQDRASVESRYQSALSALTNQLASARRNAMQFIETGALDRLPQLGQQTSGQLTGSPMAALGRRFQALCEEAAQVSWQGSWAATRENILQGLADEPEQALAQGALLLLSGDSELAVNSLLEHAALAQGSWYGRRERLLRAEALVLGFDDPADLAFIQSEFGNPALVDGALVGSADEASLLAINAAVEGDNWEAGLSLELGPIQGEQSAAVSLGNKNGFPIVMQVDNNGIELIVTTPSGKVRQQNAYNGGLIQFRVSKRNGRITIFINNETTISDRAIAQSEALEFTVSTNNVEWSLDNVQVLGKNE